jgi:antitoxin component of MazEF toxin-antitoxin module
MEKKLNKLGDSYSIILPKTLLELMQVNPKKDLIKINFNDGKIILTKGSAFEE